MKNTFKLAAIAVSMALAMSFVACSSGDDVVDASTPEYLLTAKTDSYVASLKYAQNVPETEIESLQKAYEGITKIGDGCKDCLVQYLTVLKINVNDNDGDNPLSSSDIVDAKKKLEELKTEFGKDTYHKVNVYKPAIEKAIADLYKAEAEVDAIGDPEGNTQNTILKGELNPRQSASMSAYIDAAAALKAVLSEDDAETCATTIKAADVAIENFNKLKTVAKSDITLLTKLVDAMATAIQTKVVDAIKD